MMLKSSDESETRISISGARFVYGFLKDKNSGKRIKDAEENIATGKQMPDIQPKAHTMGACILINRTLPDIVCILSNPRSTAKAGCATRRHSRYRKSLVFIEGEPLFLDRKSRAIMYYAYAPATASTPDHSGVMSANNFTKSYAEALVLATPRDQTVSPYEEKKKAGMTAEELARMEQEMEALEHDFKSVEAAYSENMMGLTLAKGYIKRLLENNRVVKYLREHHNDLLMEFQTTVQAELL